MVQGTFTYTPAFGAILPVGNNQTLQVLFAPADSTDYASVATTRTINVIAPPSGFNAGPITRTTRGSGPGTYTQAVKISDAVGSGMYFLSGLAANITVSLSGGHRRNRDADQYRSGLSRLVHGANVSFTLTFIDPNAAAPTYNPILE